MEDDNPAGLEEPIENTPDTQEQNPESEEANENTQETREQNPESEAANEVAPDTQEQNPESEAAIEITPDTQEQNPESETANEIAPDTQEQNPESEATNEIAPDTQEQNPESEATNEVAPDTQEQNPESEAANEVAPDTQEQNLESEVVAGNGSGEVTSQKEPEEHTQPLGQEGDTPSVKTSNVTDDQCPQCPKESKKKRKELYDNFNQTSLVWEKKPLAEILLRSSQMPEKSEGAEEVVTSPKDTLTVERPEIDIPSLQTFFDHPPPPTEPENQSQFNEPVEVVIQALDSDSPPMDKEQQPSQEQQPNEAKTAEDIVLVSKKTGRELKVNYNQTSLIWEKKPLAEILGSSGSAKKEHQQLGFTGNYPDPYEY